MGSVAETWRQVFLQTVQRHRNTESLRMASLEGRLGDWTETLTTVVVDTCEALGWEACGKGHPLDLFPETRSEYLTIDIMAFSGGNSDWRFPTAVIELENSSQDQRIAYSLWKVLCIRAKLRVVFCYRQNREERSSLLQYLGRSVLRALEPMDRSRLQGQTTVAVGTRDDAETFPYGFFKWFDLDRNTASFRST